MRKQDYIALARIIKTAMVEAIASREEPDCAPEMTEYWNGVEYSHIRTAKAFADAASVDKTAFLKACGID